MCINFIRAWIFVNETFFISLKFVPKGPIDDNPALVYIMARRQAIIWTNANLINWRIYATLGRDEIIQLYGVLASVVVFSLLLPDISIALVVAILLHGWNIMLHVCS